MVELRLPGPSGSETEFDHDELTFVEAVVEFADIVDSPSMDKLCILSIIEESLAVDIDPEREDGVEDAEAVEAVAESSMLIWTLG